MFTIMAHYLPLQKLNGLSIKPYPAPVNLFLIDPVLYKFIITLYLSRLLLYHINDGKWLKYLLAIIITGHCFVIWNVIYHFSKVTNS